MWTFLQQNSETKMPKSPDILDTLRLSSLSCGCTKSQEMKNISSLPNFSLKNEVILRVGKQKGTTTTSKLKQEARRSMNDLHTSPPPGATRMFYYNCMCFSWVSVANKWDKLVTNKHMCRLLSKKQLKDTQFEPCTCS